jgi:hypothetical protein
MEQLFLRRENQESRFVHIERLIKMNSSNIYKFWWGAGAPPLSLALAGLSPEHHLFANITI